MEIAIRESFKQQGYITDEQSDIALQLVLALQKPLLVEGPAGVGKTDIAKVLADVLDTRFIRLQCYEGLDANMALYEWNYAKQMLHIQLTEKEPLSLQERERNIFSDDFLLKRPLLSALLEEEKAPVLLVDEVDRADEAFEAFLLEVLGEHQVTIPELGTITAKQKPYVILTSNRSRELSDALRRRCLYQWFDYPDIAKEAAILQTKLPAVEAGLAQQLAAFVAEVRQLPLNKRPGVAESLDWAEALMTLYDGQFNVETIKQTASCMMKDRDDTALFEERLTEEQWLKRVDMSS